MVIFKYDKGMGCYVVSDLSIKYGLTNRQAADYRHARSMIRLYYKGRLLDRGGAIIVPPNMSPALAGVMFNSPEEGKVGVLC